MKSRGIGDLNRNINYRCFHRSLTPPSAAWGLRVQRSQLVAPGMKNLIFGREFTSTVVYSSTVV